jgi:hypothetical protein
MKKFIALAMVGMLMFVTGCKLESILGIDEEPKEMVILPSFVVDGNAWFEEVGERGRFAFDVSIPQPPSDSKAPVVWLYVGRYKGGKDSTTFNADLRTYKFKVYDEMGNFVGEKRFAYDLLAPGSHHVEITWGPEFISANVGGSVVRFGADMPEGFTLGIGCPPEIRGCIEGAEFTNIEWPE